MEKMKKKIPNILCYSRIVFVPVLILQAVNSSVGNFLLWSLGLLSTDILDGYFARRFEVVTKRGRKLDALADYIYYTSVVVLSMFILRDSFISNLHFVLLPTVLFFIPKFIGLYFLNKFPTLHLHSWRIVGGFLFLWLLVSLFRGFNLTMLILITLLSFVAFLEESAIYIIKRNKLDQSINSIFDIFR